MKRKLILKKCGKLKDFQIVFFEIPEKGFEIKVVCEAENNLSSIKLAKCQQTNNEWMIEDPFYLTIFFYKNNSWLTYFLAEDSKNVAHQSLSQTCKSSKMG